MTDAVLNVFHGKTALVTGASSGMGVDFARQLAAAGANLVLVARRRERLQNLAAELRLQHGVQVTVIAQDLSSTKAADTLFAKTERQGLVIDVLVNNAGFGLAGHFLNTDAEQELEMLTLNMITLTRLTRLYGAAMAQRGHGHVLLVASVAAFQPSPTLAAYAASKAYVLSLGEALAFEMRPQGVLVTVLAPGGVVTEFSAVAGQTLSPLHERGMMQSPDVVAAALQALGKGESLVVPGGINKLGVFANRLMPRKLAPRLINLIMAPTIQ